MNLKLLSQTLNQQISPKITRSSMSLSPGWFLIHVLIALSSLQNTEFSKYGLNFDSHLSLPQNYYKMYLNTEQLTFLVSQPNNFEVFPLDQRKVSLMENIKETNKYVKKLQDADANIPNQYLIHATNDWKPLLPSIKSVKLIDGYYSISSDDFIDVDELLQDKRIDSILNEPRKVLTNRYNAGYLQTGDFYGTLNKGEYEIERTLNNLGLTGKGQVVNIVDSGVDVTHPFFSDQTQEVKYFNSSTLEYNLNHRKIVSILTAADKTDYDGGHGTHCAGTVLGKADCEKCGINKYAGVAPDAKLFMVDIGESDSRNLTGQWELDKIVQQMGEKLDCHVSSNSWSSDAPYPEYSALYDALAVHNPETLHVFAAGNDGEYFTVFSPSDAKNVLTVGALNPTYPMGSHLPEYSTIYMRNGDDYVELKKAPGTGNFAADVTKETPLDWSDVPITIDGSENEGKIVLVEIENYENTTSKNNEVCETAKRLQNENARIMVFNSAVKVAANCNTTYIPILYTSSTGSYDKIESWDKCSLLLSSKGGFNQPELAYFSSKGPTWNGQFKPELTAPGFYTMSANAKDPSSSEARPSNFSALKFMSGTSMATPAIAGLVTLVREFFVDGWYETLSEHGSQSIKPTSALLRATTIASARSPYTSVIPDNEFGFGTPNLMNVFPFLDRERHGFRFVDNVTTLPNRKESYKIKVTDNTIDLSIVMSYIDDYNLQLYAKPLMVDLDLMVVSPSGKVYHGNKGTSTDTEIYNTNERVFISSENVEVGEYTIHVISNDYNREFIARYAIAVEGGFPHDDKETNPLTLPSIEYEQCIGCKGSCVDGYCVCNSSQTGADCSMNIIEVQPNTGYALTLPSGTFSVFKVKLGVYHEASPPSIIALIPDFNGYYFFAFSGSPIKKLADDNVPVVIMTSQYFFAQLAANEGEESELYFSIFAHTPISGTVNFMVNAPSLNVSTPTPTPLPTSSQTSSNTNNNQESTSVSGGFNPGRFALLCLSCVFITIACCSIIAFFCIKNYEREYYHNSKEANAGNAV